MSRAIVLALATLLIACGDSTGPNRSGSMSFTYHGSMTGSPSGVFSVAGGRKPYPDGYPTGAGGNTYGDGSTAQIRIVGSRTEGPQEFALILIGVTGAGPVPMCDTSQPQYTNCVWHGSFFPDPGSFYIFGWSLRDPPYPEMRVTITELTGSRIRGTFEGLAVGDCAGCNAQYLNADTLTISGGTFDVPYR
jgi:hypothetical protein